MKKLFVILAIVLMASTCLAIDWYYPNQRTIAWDTVDVSGATYNVYIYQCSPASTDQECVGDHSEKVLLGNTSETTYAVAVPADGRRYIVGVTSVLDSGESDVNWSDVNGASTPNPFGFRTLYAPKNLRQVE